MESLLVSQHFIFCTRHYEVRSNLYTVQGEEIVRQWLTRLEYCRLFVDLEKKAVYLNMQADTNSIIQTWIFGGQLLATTLTFLFLYNSIQAQKKANELTNKKFVYDIKPIFKRINKTIDRGLINQAQFLNYTVVLTNNPASNIEIVKVQYKSVIGFFERSPIPILAIGDEFPIIDGRFSPDDFNQEVIVKIKFSDEIGTKYEQKIFGVLADLHITPPYKI
jgi:hypothetical protein